jgi:hypothetical protein
MAAEARARPAVLATDILLIAIGAYTHSVTQFLKDWGEFEKNGLQSMKCEEKQENEWIVDPGLEKNAEVGWEERRAIQHPGRAMPLYALLLCCSRCRLPKLRPSGEWKVRGHGAQPHLDCFEAEIFPV